MLARRVFRFDEFTLDVARGCLCAGERELELRPKSFEVLRYLVENTGRLVTKDELMEAIWPNVFVTQDSLTRCISDVRTALGDDQQRIIKTVPRRGYRFVASLLEAPAEPGNRAAASDAAASMPNAPVSARPAFALSDRRLWLGAGLGLLAAAIVGVMLAMLRQPAGLPLPDKPSIAVLPFLNIGMDAGTEYLADGISEEVIVNLSKFSELFVTARDSTFSYKGRRVEPKQIGRELGVRFLLQGSVRKDADRLRISAQLVEASRSRQLWAESYDRELGGIFAIQDEVTQRIVSTLVSHIARSDLQRAVQKAPANLDAYDYYLRGNAVMRSREGPERTEKVLRARILYRQAMALDPRYARAVQGIADTYVAGWLERARGSGEYRQQSTIDLALSLARQAVELDPYLPEVHATLAWALHWHYRRSEAIAAFERSLQLNPNFADGRFTLVLYQNGRVREAIDIMRRIVRLDPFPPAVNLSYLGNAHYLAGEYETALEQIKASAQRLPGYRPSFAWQAAAAAQLGRMDEARAAAAELLRFDPEFTISWFLDTIRLMPDDAKRLAEGLRKAGLPE